VAVHEKTLAALKARDPARIEAVMDEHLAFFEQRWAAHGRLRLRRLPDFLLPRAPES
jgi:DNA-binding FadR family transcriptional regulator